MEVITGAARTELWQEILLLERELHQLNEQRRQVMGELAVKMSLLKEQR